MTINVTISLRLISILKLDSIRIGIPPFFKISLIWDFSRQQIYTARLAGHTRTELKDNALLSHIVYNTINEGWLIPNKVSWKLMLPKIQFHTGLIG